MRAVTTGVSPWNARGTISTPKRATRSRRSASNSPRADSDRPPASTRRSRELPIDTELTVALAGRIITLFCIGAAGYGAVRLGLLDRHGRESVVNVLIWITFPGLGFTSMVDTLDPARMGENVAGILLSGAHILCGCVFGYVAVRATSLEGKERATFVHLLATNNYIFMPLPIVMGLWPAQERFMFLGMLGAGTMYWIAGLYPLVRGGSWGETIRRMFNPPFVAMLAGMAVGLLGLREIFIAPEGPEAVVDAARAVLAGEEPSRWLILPRSVFAAAKLVGQATIPLALILVGAGLATAEGARRPRLMLYYSAMRLVVYPIVFLPLILLSGLPEETCGVFLLISMMPASNTSTMIAHRFGGDPEMASAANLYSTLLSGLSVPILYPLYRSLLDAALEMLSG